VGLRSPRRRIWRGVWCGRRGAGFEMFCLGYNLYCYGFGGLVWTRALATCDDTWPWMQKLSTAEVDRGVFGFLAGMKATEYDGKAPGCASSPLWVYWWAGCDNFLRVDFLRMYIFRAYSCSYIWQEMRFKFLIRPVCGPVPKLVAM
jgi:hypothetical protein